jgi:hypothetical protein
VVFEPVQRTSQLPSLAIGFDALFVTLLVERRELVRSDVAQALTRERVGPLHRDQAFIAVGE